LTLALNERNISIEGQAIPPRPLTGEFPMNLAQNQNPSPVSASLVAEGDRLSFLPRFFGECLMLRGESTVYSFMNHLSEDYSGGFWNFYTLSNGGFYMAPDYNNPMRVSVNGNGFEGELSADAAGIVANLFALSHLAAKTENDRIIELYHLLREFAFDHPESRKILMAID
jgi:hypothetical protein